MKRSSSLDCHSIGQSLKRVKISTSPGELRLDRDFESLMKSNVWTSTAQSPVGPIDHNNNSSSRPCHTNHGSSPVPSWDRRGSRIHSELCSTNARLLRDPVDPLRLRLTCLHHHQLPTNNNARSSSPIPPERWTFLIQMPRMYPHVPPVITRVTRDFVPNNNENMAYLGNRNVDYYSNSNYASAAIVASSVMQSHVEPPVPEQILIQPLPPTPNSGLHGVNNNNHHHHHGSKLLDIDVATAVFNSWSPVSSLEDLIAFLMGIPARRRDWWGMENNRRHHQQQQRLLRNHGITPLGQPTIAPATNSFSDGRQQEHFQSFCHSKQQQQQHHFSSHSDMEDDGEMNFAESMMEDAGAIPTERRVNPFATNRFDVGFDRGGSMFRRWSSQV
ncbi:hypothetical protein ACHAXR_004653 [Thalassiosira sp. AJA248-18]